MHNNTLIHLSSPVWFQVADLSPYNYLFTTDTGSPEPATADVTLTHIAPSVTLPADTGGGNIYQYDTVCDPVKTEVLENYVISTGLEATEISALPQQQQLTSITRLVIMFNKSQL